MTLAPKLNPTQPRKVTHFVVGEPPTAAARGWREIYCLVIPASVPVCAKCNGTGCTRTGRICGCAAGDDLIDALYEADLEASDDQTAISHMVYS